MRQHESGDALCSNLLVYLCTVQEKTWAFISFIQRKKRSNATTQFWYTDFSMIVLKRKKGGGDFEGSRIILQGVHRFCDCEIFLDPEYEYCFIPFSYFSGRAEVECGAQVIRKRVAPFQFTTYSANMLNVKAQLRSFIDQRLPLEVLHSFLVRAPKKISYTIGPKSLLLAINGDGCIYFLVLNGGDHGIAVNLQVQSNDGMSIAHGSNKDTSIVSPNSQQIVLVLANDGHHLSQCLNFDFKTDSVTAPSQQTYHYIGIDTKIPLSLAGDLLCRGVEANAKHRFGKGSLNDRLWST